MPEVAAGPGPRGAREYGLEVEGPLEEVLGRIEEAAEMWGAAWEPAAAGGRLGLPVNAGIRRGVLSGPLRLERRGDVSRLSFRVEEEHYGIHWQAVAILAAGGFGGLVSVLWPIFPALLPLAPAGVVLAIAAWLMVGSRLRSSTPDDFLELVRVGSGGEPPGGGS